MPGPVRSRHCLLVVACCNVVLIRLDHAYGQYYRRSLDERYPHFHGACQGELQRHLGCFPNHIQRSKRQRNSWHSKVCLHILTHSMLIQNIICLALLKALRILYYPSSEYPPHREKLKSIDVKLTVRCRLQSQTIAMPATTPVMPANRSAGGLSGGAIAGVVVSAVAAAVSLIIAFFLWRRIRNRSAKSESEEGGEGVPAITPFAQVGGYLTVPQLEIAATAPSNTSSKRQRQVQWGQRSPTPSSSAPPISPEPTSASAYSSSTNNQLRDVVEDLRREVELMRGHTNYAYAEPPPEY